MQSPPATNFCNRRSLCKQRAFNLPLIQRANRLPFEGNTYSQAVKLGSLLIIASFTAKSKQNAAKTDTKSPLQCCRGCNSKNSMPLVADQPLDALFSRLILCSGGAGEELSAARAIGVKYLFLSPVGFRFINEVLPRD